MADAKPLAVSELSQITPRSDAMAFPDQTPEAASSPVIVGNHSDALELMDQSLHINSGTGSLALMDVRNHIDHASFDSIGFQFLAENLSSGSRLGTGAQTYPTTSMNQCLKELSDLNVELHAQSAAVLSKSDDTSLTPYICLDPEHINVTALTPVEASLNAIEKFYSILVILEKLSPSQPSPYNAESDATIFPTLLVDAERCAPIQELETPLILAIISCYVQLVNIFHDFFGRVDRHIKRIRENQTLGKLFQLGTFSALDGRLQGLVFTSMVSHYFDRTERLLGILPEDRPQRVPIRQALLYQPCHLELLQRELAKGGIAGSCDSTQLREAVENIRCTLVADPSW
ncbi:hypothetical protein PFICI_03049 [Pestalotiopsis fici W106-1]|uniref:Uncharacterized protein n=1 Tax=Pestalotiopsis fici (strain W106-1 / CGMCC3.15140) TaxID=1229662 RepID=W3XG88_PESFW|nr:uncharacterized protein PFICI_03049 [Pestalotiopsis fici W106-1]ETS85024.1 hypothetical protein PFICI_03049 [Pestalotiopsis fici W106-1]